jgi:SAM-dependent methyltransferase
MKQEAFIEKAKFYHRENQNNNIEIIRNDIVDFTLENRVDYVFLSGVTIYLNDTAFNSLIEKIKSYLKPGGKIIHRDAYGRHERYVVNNYSEALKMNYSALYRTRDEYDEILVHKHHFKKIYDEDMYAGGENSPFNKWKETRLRLACYQNIKDMACK